MADRQESIESLSDEQMIAALDQFAEAASTSDVTELFQSMADQGIMSYDDVKFYMNDNLTGVVKSGLPENTRPSEPENDTNIDSCITKLNDNDPSLTAVNINNMKRAPIPQIQRLINGISKNEHVLKLEMANINLTDNGAQPLIDAVQQNKSLSQLNLETNYLSGDFIVSLFKALLVNQTLEEIRVTNQGVTVTSQHELDITAAICDNVALTRVGFTFRKHECRIKVDQALMKNNERRRILRKMQRQADAQGKDLNEYMDEISSS